LNYGELRNPFLPYLLGLPLTCCPLAAYNRS